MKKLNICLILLTALLTCSLVGCCLPSSDMPFNGEVDFHELHITIPESYIRDSTQSHKDLWTFEQNGYDKVIILSRQDLSGDANTLLDGYVEVMLERQATSQRTTFCHQDAVHSTYTKDDVYCQEMLFVYNGSIYAIALRGGTEEDFFDILSSASLAELPAEM